MQSLNLNSETCKAQNTFIKNEIFKTSKISFCCTEDSAQTNTPLGCFERSCDSVCYGSNQEQLPKVENLSKQTIEIPSENSSKDFKNSFKNEGTSEKAHSNIKISLTNSSIMKKDVLKDSSPSGEEAKTLKCFFRSKKVGEIISTSRTGHLIEKKGENCFVVSDKGDANAAEGCDSNDNIIIEPDKSSSEMHDINDNPSEKLVYQKEEEEASLSDNARSANSDCEAPCGIGLLERLIRSHPVWFLPGIQRAGAVHLLQGKEEGNFIVRQSSQPDTMAVSVRLPVGKGPYIEHYLIQATDGQLSLESSENMFESIPSLIAHYCQCCDELPVQLTLPRTIREARNRQQLSSLALLGQEFWRYPMANPRPPESRNSSPNSNKSDSLSSFDGVKKLVKQNNEIVLDLVPLHRDSQPSSLSTFKSSSGEGVNSSAVEETKPKRPHTLDLICTNSEKIGLSHSLKTPPQPPPRWTKPTSLITKQFSSVTTSVTLTSPTTRTNQTTIIEEEKKEFGDCSSFISSTYPTTNPSTPVTHYNCNVSSPQSDQTNLKSFAFERDVNSLKHFQEMKRPQLISPVSDNTSLVSKGFEKVHITPSPASTPTEKGELIFKKYKKDTKLKESAHYQECDILESPTLYYYKSNVADKQSDYEDIWATDSFTTFKPSTPQIAEPETRKNQEKSEFKKPPDLLEKLDKKLKIPEKRHEKSFISSDNCDTEEQDVDGAQNSPFYAEPADALVVRRKTRMSFNKSRHSDPFSFNNWSASSNPYFSGGNVLDRIDSQNEVNEDVSWKGKPSLSFDNIINLKKKEGDGKPRVAVKCKNVGKAKPVRPPKVDSAPTEKSHQNWTVDSSWEFIGNDEAEKEGERRFPSLEQQMDSVEAACKYTVQEIITQRFPQFKISKGFHASSTKNNSFKENPSFSYQMSFPKSDNISGSRISAYDNLTCDRPSFFKQGSESDSSEANCDNYTGSCPNDDDYKLSESLSPKYQVSSDTLRFKKRMDCGSVTEDNEDAQTIFSEPWDSSRWENLLPASSSSIEEPCFEGRVSINGVSNVENGNEELRMRDKIPRKLELSLPLSGLKSKEVSTMGASIRSYALHLASDKSTTFAQNIDNFIDCTLESKETNPQVVMRNMRQFMSGMKNYLVKHGEREFEKQVEKERMKLKSTEFLNLDAILEGVMHKLVVRPLREHLYKLFVDEYIKNGAIQLLYDNLIYARTKSLHDLGLRTKITPPCQEALQSICHFILKLQEVDSPLEKLDHLLACVSTIIHSVKLSNQEKANIALGADDILPLFVWVLVQSSFIAAEIESEYMWGLLHPSLLSGEGCYYLTTLSSAVHVLKNLKSCDLEQPNRMTPEWHCGEMKSVLKVIVPDELHGSILTKTLPVKPNMTTKDVCKIIAHKIRITNPQDYGLFRLVDGEETLLNDNECPQDIKSQLLKSGKHCTLAYKRIDAKIGWPRTT